MIHFLISLISNFFPRRVATATVLPSLTFYVCDACEGNRCSPGYCVVYDGAWLEE